MTSTETPVYQDDLIIRASQIFFAIGIIGIGIQHFMYSNFIPVMLPWWPPSIPGRASAAYFLGALLASAGVLIIIKKQARIAATRLGMFFLFLFILILFIKLTHNKLADLLALGFWTNTLKEFAFCGGAFVVAASFPKNQPDSGREISTVERIENKLIVLGKFPLAIMVFLFGIDHFIYVQYVASLVPSWIPGHIFWTYFAGAALVAAGVGIILNLKARLAATMLGVMLFIWVIILHIPRAVADPSGNMGNELTSVFEALAFCGVAFIMGRTLTVRNKTK